MGFRTQARANWSAQPDEIAIEFEGRQFTWREIGNLAAELEKTLDRAGVSRNALIGIIARNRPGPVAAISAFFGNGRCFTMIYSAQTAAGIASDIVDLGLAAVVADPGDWVAETIAAARATGTLGISVDPGAEKAVTQVPQIDALGSGPFRQSRQGIAMELLSSGTTGKPKRLEITEKSLEESVIDASDIYASPPGENRPGIVVFHPISNMAAISFLIPMLVCGQRLELMERFDLEKWLDAVGRQRPGRTSLPPPVLQTILDEAIPRERLEPVGSIGVGASMLDPTLQAAFEEHYGIPLLISYGATEFCGVIANWTPEMHRRDAVRKRGSVGTARPGVKLRVVDPDTGNELKPGEPGVLEAKIDRLGPEWVRTTDLASLDEDGFLYLHGRSDGTINRGGFKVLPDKVATAIREHPAIADAAVIGMPDKRLGEVPVAAVECKPGAQASRQELTDILRTKLLAYEVPVDVHFFAALPRNATMKVDLKRLREILSGAAEQIS